MFVRYFIIYKRFVLEEQAIFNEEFRGRLSVEIYAFFNYVWNRYTVPVSILFSAAYNHAPIKMTLLGTIYLIDSQVFITLITQYKLPRILYPCLAQK